MTTILIVDDVPAMVEQYAYDLKRVGGYDTLTASGGREGLDLLTAEPVDCVLLDLEMPEVDGFEFLRRISENNISVPVIVYTGTGNYDRCVRAMKLGAFGFIDKEEPIERVASEVEKALERRRLGNELDSLRKRLDIDSAAIGSSKPMQELNQAIARLAGVPSTVLVVGESGTGKELVARDIHQAGSSPRDPFVAVNCAALPDNLIESELFGHEKGAFTGADTMRVGAFEAAGRGTIFLDEISELPLQSQAKLLRVLEQKTLSRIGGSKEISVDARVIAATNRDLEEEVDDGRFRQDLLFRLNVHVIRVPSLRERLSDVPELVGYFLEKKCAEFGIPQKTIVPDALQRLCAYDWRKNNVRELRNAVERMIIAGEGDVIGPEHIPGDLADRGGGVPASEARTLAERRAEAERAIVLEALQRNDWHITNTAKELGLADHSSLIKVMKRHHIDKP